MLIVKCDTVFIYKQLIMKYVIESLLFIWQLPQHIVAGFLFLFCKTKKLTKYNTSNVYITYSFGGGISLGNYILVSEYSSKNPDTIAHEYGHSIQSRWLGPLYLIVIGLPSIMWAWLHNSIAPNKSYYWFYTERLADKLGGVERDKKPNPTTGPQGPQGPQGPAGKNGRDGKDGKDGRDGKDGQDGRDGRDAGEGIAVFMGTNPPVDNIKDGDIFIRK